MSWLLQHQAFSTAFGLYLYGMVSDNLEKLSLHVCMDSYRSYCVCLTIDDAKHTTLWEFGIGSSLLYCVAIHIL